MNGFADGSHALIYASVKTSFSFLTTSKYTPRFGNSFPSGPRITIRFAPPGRTSSSTTGVVQGRGVNHFLRSSGSVQARKTFSRGALMIKEMASSRSDDGVTGTAVTFDGRASLFVLIMIWLSE